MTVHDAATPVVPVSAEMRRAKVRAATDHTTVGLVDTTPDGRVTIACACGIFGNTHATIEQSSELNACAELASLACLGQ